MKQLSIIVPVYNVEKYICACLESIYGQGLAEDSYEVIVVNDGTKDGSMEAIRDVVGAHPNTIVIDQPNQGLSVARNNGMERATGEYIAFVDSDDLLARQSLAPLMERAAGTGADLVVADFKKMGDDDIDRYTESAPAKEQRPPGVMEGTGHSLFLNHLNPRECYVWRTLYRRAFLRENNIRFVPGVCFEDVPFTHECYLKAGKCLKVDSLLYLYRVGHASITSAIGLRAGKDFGTIVAKTWALRELPGLSPEIRERLEDHVFASFSVLVYATIHDVGSPSDRKAIISHLLEVAPDLHFAHGMKQRLVDFMYHNMPFAYVSLRVMLAKLAK